MRVGIVALSLLLGAFGHQLSSEEATIRAISASGRCATLAESLEERVGPKPNIAPGEPPLLRFRYYEGQAHHRYGNADLMLDDAGH